MSINILGSEVFNRIAAGEVIERPRSVIKELVENSIDAKAKNITIEIKNGGISYIRVTDDGCGLTAEDVKKAFLPHATSKIKSLEDLDAILTLGFRGEALSSIASVSTVEMMSKQSDAYFGNKIAYDNGSIIEQCECGCQNGTVITVRDLFEKVPARKKFLAKPSVEEHEITSLIGKLILANPNVAFRYFADGEEKLIANGKGIKEAIYSVYGKEIFDELTWIENINPDISLKGYIGKIGCSKHNRSFQSLVVNGRNVINSEISYMMQNLYSDYLMVRQYPVYVLYIDLPADMLDVNIHPNKMEVKFADFNKIKKIISATVKAKLFETVQPKEIIYDTLFGTDTKDIQKEKTGKETDSQNIPTKQDLKGDGNNPQSLYLNSLSSKNINFGKSSSYKLNENFHGSILTSVYSKSNYDNQNPQNFTEFPTEIILDKKEEKPEIKDSESQQTILCESNSKILGTLFATYILIEKDNNLYIIDQHAAHERILYDKLIKQYDNKKISQHLLVPYIFSVSYEEAEELKSLNQELEKFGFIISEIGKFDFSLSAIPLTLSDIDLNEFVYKLLDLIKSNKFSKVSNLMKDKIAEIACKAAVKGNDQLSEMEIESLIKEIGEIKILQCPHGRPLIIKITKGEIEKWFKRKL